MTHLPPEAAPPRQQTRRSAAVASITMDAAAPVFVIGDKVIAVYHAYEGGGRGYRGIIAVVEGNDKYTVRYDDQDVESGVHARFITPAKKRMYSNMSPEEQAKKKKKGT